MFDLLVALDPCVKCVFTGSKATQVGLLAEMKAGK